MPGSLRIGTIAGIEIRVHVSWLIIVVLISWSAESWFSASYPGWAALTYWLVGLLAALLLFASVLAHELAHSLVARARGLPVKNITLFIFGGVSDLEQEPKSAGVEFQMAFVGPITSLLIGGLAYLFWLALAGASSPLAALLAYLALTNVLLGVFNLVPGFPLDGGRVLRSIIWKISGNLRTATRVATLLGQVIAYLLIFTGIWLFFTVDLIDGIWFGLIGWFLLNGAQAANSQMVLETMLKGVTVRQVMNASPVTISANIAVQKLVDEVLLPRGLRSVFVVQGEQLAGLITLSDIRHLPREQWEQTLVGWAMLPLERLHTATPEQSLNEVVALMATHNVNQLPVVEDGHLVGVLSREDIIRFLEVRQGLWLETAGK